MNALRTPRSILKKIRIRRFIRDVKMRRFSRRHVFRRFSRCGGLRSLLDSEFEPRHRAGYANCGLVKDQSGTYVGVFKNCTYNFCEEMSIKVPQNLEPMKVVLYKLCFDDFSRRPTPIALRIVLESVPYEPGELFVEDVRLFLFRGEVWAIAALNGHENTSWPVMGKIEGDVFHCKKLLLAACEPPQKNWSPFILNDRIYVEISINPHIVAEVDEESGRCVPLRAGSFVRRNDYSYRGGAITFLPNIGFLGLGHFFIKPKNSLRHYFSFFYLFDAERNLHITKVSLPIKFDARHRIEFVSGLVCSGDSLLVSYGVNDCDNLFVRISLSDALETLLPVESVENDFPLSFR